MLHNRSRQHTAAIITGTLTVVILGMASATVASAQCADPRGNSYCPNNGQVTFNPPPSGAQPAQPVQPVQPAQPAQTGGTTAPAANNPAVQPNAPATANATLVVDPPSAPASATITITATGLGPNRSTWVNLSHMTTTAGLNLGAKQLATVNTAPDGTLNTTVTIPAVPSWTAGKADICLINASAQPVCAPFTLATAEQAAINSATTPEAIVGHYQCSSATLIGFGGGWCTGGEPVLALNPDQTYAYGDEQGAWSFDGTTVTFDGSLGTATVLNRRLTIDTQVDMPDGSGVQAVRYIYIRMNY